MHPAAIASSNPVGGNSDAAKEKPPAAQRRQTAGRGYSDLLREGSGESLIILIRVPVGDRAIWQRLHTSLSVATEIWRKSPQSFLVL